MKCPRCGSSSIRAIATNGYETDRVTRKRRCDTCWNDWYTIELQVNKALVGWERMTTKGQSKPILRVPVELAVGEGAV